MKYRFFSRKNGYANSENIAKYYYSDIINDNDNITKQFIDKNGSDIVDKIINFDKDIQKKHYELIEQLKKLSKTYQNWYYYPFDTKITEARIFI